MWSRLTVPLLTLLLGLVACTPLYVVHPARTPALNLQGPPPDVVIFSMSGRCGPPCLAPRDNWDYLGSRGTLDRLADVFTAAGYRVQVSGYASNAAATFSSEYIGGPQRGYEALRSDFARVAQTWMKAARPPRLVLLGHSQGSVWLHHLARVNPYVPVALQVDLDGICVAWKSDFGEGIRELGDVYGDEPSPLQACDAFTVAGRTVGAKDIVWPNVALDLEVQSKRLPARPGASGGWPVNYLFEVTPNVRLDGTRTGIERFISSREDHSAISFPNSDALAWVAVKAAAIAQQWQAEDARLDRIKPGR
ncbi:hypothetical protein [Deinococcus radiopugnans]|uniref:Alpha/beta hydrolase n=1 Tax=Deinococcus radiopugnans ATCC 19172 TaxID=585398 RepID=A0A5C4XWK4_9DEIO|nr:hypothetical protein [Deinococcus radiopugnans]MBB6018432.1 hypothetical protein [Deinococcus radiopugnans ATCC 19172]TNM67559.1 hypothetical protein FHR04_18025 [Deinococcus radiopugnans ATCC 19172]